MEGYWEAERRYYIEIRNDKILIRDYSKTVISDTLFKIKKQGQRKLLHLRNNGMAYGKEKPFAQIEELYLENGELHMLYHYSTTPKKKEQSVLQKVENGPFDNIILHDDEIGTKLAGRWIDENGSEVLINGCQLKMISASGYTEIDEKIHFIEYKTMQGRFYIVPEDLTRESFKSFSCFTFYEDGRLETTPIIFDMNPIKSRVFYKDEKWICRACGTENNRKFCRECGAARPANSDGD